MGVSLSRHLWHTWTQIKSDIQSFTGRWTWFSYHSFLLVITGNTPPPIRTPFPFVPTVMSHLSISLSLVLSLPLPCCWNTVAYTAYIVFYICGVHSCEDLSTFITFIRGRWKCRAGSQRSTLKMYAWAKKKAGENNVPCQSRCSLPDKFRFNGKKM